MKTIQLKISDKVYNKFILLLSKFDKDDIEIISDKNNFIASEKYSKNNFSEIDNTTNSYVSENIIEKEDYIKVKDKKDWFSEITKEEQEEIKIGLKQADQGNFITNEDVMKRFHKWH